MITPPSLRDFLVPSLIRDVTESVAADDGAAVHDDARPEAAAFTHHHIGVEEGIIADDAVIADKYTRIERDPRSDRDTVSHGHPWPDRCISADGDFLPRMTSGEIPRLRAGRTKKF